jgi:hypothetical protein
MKKLSRSGDEQRRATTAAARSTAPRSRNIQAFAGLQVATAADVALADFEAAKADEVHCLALALFHLFRFHRAKARSRSATCTEPERIRSAFGLVSDRVTWLPAREAPYPG